MISTIIPAERNGRLVPFRPLIGYAHENGPCLTECIDLTQRNAGGWYYYLPSNCISPGKILLPVLPITLTGESIGKYSCTFDGLFERPPHTCAGVAPSGVKHPAAGTSNCSITASCKRRLPKNYKKITAVRVCLFVNIAASRAAKQQLPAAAPQAKTSTSSRCLPALTWGVRRQRVLKAVHAPISPPPVVLVSASARVTDGEKFEAAPLAAAVHINARILSKLFGKPECDGISPDKGCASALPVPVARIPHAGAASEWVDDGRTGYSTWCEPPRRGLCAVEALLARSASSHVSGELRKAPT